MRTGHEPRAGDGLGERPLGELLRELVQEGQGLLREEVRYAKAEIRDEAKKAARGGAAIGAGGVVLHVALFLLGITLVLVGDTFLPAWLSALIVTAIFAGAGWAAIQKGRSNLSKADPSRPVEALKEDGRWAKETMRDIRSSRSANA